MPRAGMRTTPLRSNTEYFLNTPEGTIRYCLQMSSRRRTIEIQVTDQADVRVAAPSFASLAVIEGFLRERLGWILRECSQAERRQAFVRHRDYATGQEFLFLGKTYPLYIEPSAGRGAAVTFDAHGWMIRVSRSLEPEARRRAVKRALMAWYRSEAMEVMGPRVFHFVRRMEMEPLTLGVKTQKRIWGCCYYQKKRIFLNWLLVLAPVDVIDYVIVHELVHLTHPDHSQRFWAMVASYLPDYQQRQDWLKHHALEMKLPE